MRNFYVKVPLMPQTVEKLAIKCTYIYLIYVNLVFQPIQENKQ